MSYNTLDPWNIPAQWPYAKTRPELKASMPSWQMRMYRILLMIFLWGLFPPLNAQGMQLAKVTLLEPGNLPRQLQEWTPTVGSTQKLQLVLEIQSVLVEDRSKPQPIKKPPIVLSVRGRVDRKATAFKGSRRSLVIEEAHLDPAYNASDVVEKVYRPELDALVGTKAVMELSSFGKFAGIAVEPGKLPKSKLMEALQESLFQIGTMVAPLPMEPIGVGARWQADLDVLFGGVLTPCKVQYQLKSISGRTLLIEGQFEQTMDPSLFASPFMDVEFKPTAMRMTGGVSVKLDLDLAQPLESDFKLKIYRIGKANKVAGSQSIEHETNIHIQLGTGPEEMVWAR